MSIQHMQMVFDAGDLSGSEKAVLLAYCNHTDAHGYTWAGVERVADMTGFSEKTVKNVRKALKERNLLRSSARVERSGRRKTDISRINLTKLASLKLPPREYKDNVIAELEFEDEELSDTTPDQPKGTGCPKPDQPKGSSYPHQGKQVPLQEGEAVTPYPSVDPSLEPSSSSAEVEDITHEVTPPVVEKKTKRESPEAIIERRLGCTPDEAASVATLINQQGDGRGGRIRSLAWWVGDRDIHTLRQDLAMVRGSQGPADASKPLDEGERIRRMQKGGYAPYKNPVDQDVYDEPLLPVTVPEKTHTGSRGYVPPNEYWDGVSDEGLKNSFL
jgi:hypothetical protein